MEPRAIAHLNGTLINAPSLPPATPNRYSASSSNDNTISPTKEFLNLPETPMTQLKGRRKSVQWVRGPVSPEDNLGRNGNGNGAEDEDELSSLGVLSPVPETPDSADVRARAEALGMAETPGTVSKTVDLVMQTCPRGGQTKGYGELSGGGEAVGRDGKGKAVMQRLLLARRKSLQWAPKVGSPLARGASYGY